MNSGFPILLLVLLLSACVAPKPVLPPAPAAEVLVQRLLAASQKWQQLDADAEVSLWYKEKYLAAQQLLLLEKPDRLRVDVMTLFGQQVLQLAVDQGRLQYVSRKTVPSQYYQGPASRELLARFMRLPLPPVDLVQLLLYDPPRSDSSTVSVETTTEHYLLRMSNGPLQQQFFFNQKLELSRCVYLRDESAVLLVDYDRIDSKDSFPRRIVLELPPEKIRISIVFSKLKLNQPAETDHFRLSFPKGAEPMMIPSQGSG